MSAKKDTTHILVDHKLVLFKRPRSQVWQCRFQIDGKWQRESTGCRELAEARDKAFDLLMEAGVRKKLNYVPVTRSFKNVAEYTIKRLDATKASNALPTKLSNRRSSNTLLALTVTP